MTQQDVAGKILIELLEAQIINEKDEILVWEYLVLAFGAGYDLGRKDKRGHPNARPVIQLSLSGKKLGVFTSITEAASAVRMRRSTIGSALQGKSKTAGGFKWEYVELIATSEEETIEQLKPKSTRQVPKSRASKKNSV